MINKLREKGCEMDTTMERFMGDEEFYIECFEKFAQDNELGELGKILEAGDLEDAFRQAHQLKGTLSNLGLVPVLQELSVIVEILRGNSWEGVPEQYEKMMNVWNGILHE